MQWEIDHVFLACPEPEAPKKALTDFGVALEQGRTHQGQGTASLCAFFENAYLELLFPVASDELSSEIVKPLGLRERIYWQDTGACPFGVCFRPSEPLTEQDSLPVECWHYTPAYVPQGLSIPIVTPRGNINEPLVFLSTRVGRSPQRAMARHRGTQRALSRVKIQHPAEWRPSEGVHWFAANAFLSLCAGTEYNLELVWGNGANGQGKIANLPLSVSW